MPTPRFVAVALLWATAALPLRAQPPDAPAVRLPETVRTPPGRIVKLAAESNGPQVRWALTTDDADLVPFPDGKVALFSAPRPGRFLVLAWTAVGDLPSEAARCVVVVGDEPEPPQPVDAFTEALRQRYQADPSPEKQAHLAQLAVLYREAVAFAGHAEVRTAGELASRLRRAANTLLPAAALVAVRQRIAEEITRELPPDRDTPLDDALRHKASRLFDRIATSLENVK